MAHPPAQRSLNAQQFSLLPPSTLRMLPLAVLGLPDTDLGEAIDRFGPERCMFESNFPVDKVSVSYAVLWNAFKRIAAGFREEEKDAMFYGTATRFYRI